MAKKKTKTRDEKITKKHDFKHLTKTKIAAKMVEADTITNIQATSPLDKQIKKDLNLTSIIIGIFVLGVIALWLTLGRNDLLLNSLDKIKLF